jgi:hypothetical protein
LPLVGLLPSAGRDASPRQSGMKNRVLSVKNQRQRLHFMPSTDSIAPYKSIDDAENSEEALTILVSSRKQHKMKQPQSRQVVSQVSSSLKDILDTSCTDCNDFIATFTEDARRDYKQFIPHLGTRKTKSAVIQAKVIEEKEDWPTGFQIGPGYVLHQSKSKIRMNIDSAKFFGPRYTVVPPETPKKTQEEEIQSDLINQLQQQVLDLQVLLEEERMNHGDTKRILTEEMHRKVAILQMKHDELVKSMLLNHKIELEQLHEDHLAAIQREKEEFEKMKERLTADINYITASFEAYKVSSSEEIIKQLALQEAALKDQFEKEKLEALQALQKRLKEEFRAELENVNFKHKREL